MKRFLLFSYCDYYPSGGMNDFIKDFDIIIEAYGELTTIRGDTKEIYDNKKMQVVDIEELIKIGLLNYV